MYAVPWAVEVQTSEDSRSASSFRVQEIPEDPTITCWLDEGEGDTEYICTEVSSILADLDLEHDGMEDSY